MEKKLRPVLVAALVFFFVLVGIQSAVWASPGAIWTTDATGTAVNDNLYEYKWDVYLNGGPTSEKAPGLPPGDYYIQVTEPDGPVLGRSWNEPPTIIRQVRVVDGRFRYVLENSVIVGDIPPVVNLWDFLFSAESGFTTNGYDDTTNPGNEYKVWASQSQDFAEQKTDNFKVEGVPPEERAHKIFELTVPAVLIDNPPFTAMDFYALYTFDDPAVLDPPAIWDNILLPNVTKVGDNYVFSSGDVEFADQSTIWWKFTVTATGYLWESPVYGGEEGETLSAPGTYTNQEVLKVFRLRVPAILVEHPAFQDVVFKASYSDDWPGEVVLNNPTKEDDTYMLIGLALFQHGETISWQFTAEGIYYSWESAIGVPETLPTDTNINEETILDVLKTFELTVPAILVDHPAFAGIVFRAWYRFIDPAGIAPPSIWYSLDLKRVGATYVYDGEILFADGTEIERYFTADAAHYHWQSDVYGPEPFVWPGPYTNEEEIPTLTKTWILHVYPNGSGATYFAAWSLDKATWYDEQLEETSPGSGVWTEETVFPVGIEIYYKFYGKISGSVFWESGVFPPEIPERLTEDKTNEFWYSMPRTIGYWKNWGNHFPTPTMVIIVGEVNSNPDGGFSKVFRAGTTDVAGDTGYYRLTVGTSGSKGAIPGVAGYLQEHKADTMLQMLRAQLLGLELNVAVYQVRASIPPATNEGMIVGVSPDAIVYLSKASSFPGYGDSLVNPWHGNATQTVLQIIQTVEDGATFTYWPASDWSRAKQEFAKNIIEAINQYGDGGGIGILEP